MEIVPWKYNNPLVDRKKLDKHEFLFQGQLLEILQNNSVEVTVDQNTAYKLWDGAYLLARHLENTDIFGQKFWLEKQCIEVGAGCGLVSQVACLLGAHVTATDLKDTIDHTSKCLHNNVDKLDEYKNNIDIKPYCWGDEPNGLNAPYDIIFGSDVIYQPKLAKCFVKGLERLSGPNTLILLSYKARGLGEDITFQILKKQGFHIKTMPKDLHPHEFMNSNYDILHVTRSQ